MIAKVMFEEANKILGFSITDIMFAGTEDELKQTKVTQPAIFLHSVILAHALGDKFNARYGCRSFSWRVFCTCCCKEYEI
jgi:malonyl CoA-acyl carrier protein transacylase